MKPHAAFLKSRTGYIFRGQPCFFVLFFQVCTWRRHTFVMLCFPLYLSLALITTTVFDLQFKPNRDTISSDESHWVSAHCCYMLFSNALSPTITFLGSKLHNIHTRLLSSICTACSKSNDVGNSDAYSKKKLLHIVVLPFKANMIHDDLVFYVCLGSNVI